MYAAVDPLQPWRVRAAIRYWRDIDEEKDFAFVWVNGARQKFSRPCYVQNINSKRLMTRISGGWEPETDLIETDGAPPVVVYTNPGGAGVFETHIDLINRINSGVLQRLSTMAMQAFRQRALKKEGDKPLPAVDDKGNAIDYAAIFEPAPERCGISHQVLTFGNLPQPMQAPCSPRRKKTSGISRRPRKRPFPC